MRYSIVTALALLAAACAAQPPLDSRTYVADNAASFDASPSSAVVVAEPSESSAAEVSADIEQVAVAPAGADAADTPADSSEPLQVRTLSIEEADSGRVCESVQRPGSRMTRTVCYTREERLANQEARKALRDEQLSELQREQRWRDEIIRQAEMSGRRPSGFGLGPN